MSDLARLGTTILAVSFCGCSAVQSSYVKAGYNFTAPDAVKRIAIVGVSTPEHPGLDALLGAVVTDRVGLRMNYIVYHSSVVAGDWREACTAPAQEEAEATAERELEGVLSIRVLNIAVGDEVELHLLGELHRCNDGELLWRADGSEGNAAADEDLSALTQSYVDNLGPQVEPYAAPAFLVLRDMLDTLPDPVLNDDEVMEKIELGRILVAPPPGATTSVALLNRRGP